MIKEFEAIERNQVVNDKEKGSKIRKKNEKASSSAKSRDKEKDNGEKFYCTEHGANKSHNTSECWTLKKKKKANSEEKSKKSEQRTFSNRAFRKEINLMARASSKKKVLELYATAVAREQAKLKRSESKKKRKQPAVEEISSDSDSESDSDRTVNMAEMHVPVIRVKKSKTSHETTPEEKTYLEKINHEDSDSSMDD